MNGPPLSARAGAAAQRRFLVHTFGSALLLFACYAALATRLLPAGGEAQDQWQDNLMRAQWYAHHSATYSVVVTGSSMAARAANEELPEGFYNLAMSGGGALTGMEIVARSRSVPRMVLVEADDTLSRPADARLIDPLFQPVSFRLRSWVPVLGDAYQPVSVALRLVRQYMPGGGVHPLAAPPALFDEMVAVQKAAQEKLPDPENVDEWLRSLAAATQRLESRGVVVAFFETPVAPLLGDSPSRRYVRTALVERFPPQHHLWLPRATADESETTDGMHLSPAAGRKFARFLAAEVARVLPNAPVAVAQ
jgi:hypothetical protein